ncbi:methyl-accepting chemotaxis protein [Bradyrhizobium canariense]|uniref:methyl-accepting chemotaxis protein n=1 Tax=Bradyrhizobium canariense TaxID=255045 RepID=UPI001B8A65FB|nr:PAS domain-containing methyl-accepting chemotaxis protein [Bradyrhizobium canariense]MBR0955213.1 PAS domain-containing methyl-accepting chemotaxis protein [Bradyrhizobium canariense]
MLGMRKRSDVDHAFSQVQAMNKSQAVIEFKLDGTIITANENFLQAMGYGLDEIRGKHHSIFLPAAERDTAEYREFWSRLKRGEFQSAQYRRVSKDGTPIWIQASYNPIFDKSGKPASVIKFATNITAGKIKTMEDAGKIAAIDRAQAVIEFNLDGTIIAANGNFLKAMGYGLDEIIGKHHSIFVDAALAASPAYLEFWATLNRGEHLSAEYKRFGKGGREIWILASYNPILDETGKPFKVVKFATDVTEQKLRAADTNGQIEAIKKSQAVIEFDIDGTIRWANQNFLDAMGYALPEIQGRHHGMFVEAAYRNSPEYAEFWRKLNRGEFQAAEYKRLAKGRREIWIQASYNPIMDLNGKPFKIVKYASDVTAQAVARMKAERARELIESVAAGSEEMNASIREISETMVKSRQTTINAVSQVEAADTQARRLSSAAESMGGIVGLIGNITGQINLLALNATIESARAGDAGRGFAVVASEVKGLATQAKQATEKITSEIEALNAVSGDVAGSLAAIRSAIGHVSEYVANTAAAVEEQSAVTNDIASNMQRAAAELA